MPVARDRLRVFTSHRHIAATRTARLPGEYSNVANTAPMRCGLSSGEDLNPRASERAEQHHQPGRQLPELQQAEGGERECEVGRAEDGARPDWRVECRQQD